MVFHLFHPWCNSIYRRIISGAKAKNNLQKTGSIYLHICLHIRSFHIFDYVGVIFYQKPPVYRYITETNGSTVVYHSLFYNVYRLNKDTPEEYYVVDNEKKYTLETISEPINIFTDTGEGGK